MEKYFLIQIKRTNGTIEKGVVVKDTEDDVWQGYHAYLGAYAYGKDPNTDYVYAAVINVDGVELEHVCWNHTSQPEPEPTEEA